MFREEQETLDTSEIEIIAFFALNDVLATNVKYCKTTMRATFSFDLADVEDLLELYEAGEARVCPRDFSKAIRATRRIIHAISPVKHWRRN